MPPFREPRILNPVRAPLSPSFHTPAATDSAHNRPDAAIARKEHDLNHAQNACLGSRRRRRRGRRSLRRRPRGARRRLSWPRPRRPRRPRSTAPGRSTRTSSDAPADARRPAARTARTTGAAAARRLRRAGGGGGFGGGWVRRRRAAWARGGGGMGGGDEQRGRGRMREAMRDVMNPPDHLIITRPNDDDRPHGRGRPRRRGSSPDGKKVKDDNTKIEREDQVGRRQAGLGDQGSRPRHDHRELHRRCRSTISCTHVVDGEPALEDAAHRQPRLRPRREVSRLTPRRLRPR